MGSKEWHPDSIFALLTDEIARDILPAVYDEPASASELADQLDVSLPTIYRRINALTEYDLLTRQLATDPAGNQYHQYKTTLHQCILTVEDGEVQIQLKGRSDIAAQFETLWTDLTPAHAFIESEQQSTDDTQPHLG
ncbi:MAG: helix-turn-helix domain-containing protein [Halobacteriales archaeon]|nr:helix-turn-helix domain-containing protein [Halobacteriales archaeon]